LNSADLTPVVDPAVKNGIQKAIEAAQQKMGLCEEKKTEVKGNYSDVDTESTRLKELEVCMP
jgi:hypothetical protein